MTLVMQQHETNLYMIIYENHGTCRESVCIKLFK